MFSLALPVCWAVESVLPLGDPVANLVQAKKKKKNTKHNYRSLTATNVTGDDTNGDSAVLPASLFTNQSFYYRKVPVAGLSLTNPFPLRIERNATPVSGFEEEHWGGYSAYYITEGNVWLNYGYKVTSTTPPLTSFTGTGDYRIINYNGGTRKKATKRQALHVYNFSVSGSESDSDTTAETRISYSAVTMTYYYRKISIPGLRVANLGDYRLMRKNPYYQGVSGDYLAPAASGYYFFTDDYLYVAYGSKMGIFPYTTIYTPASMIGDYQLYLYSDGKKKKKKLTKQYVKKYTFNVPGGEATADKITPVTSTAPAGYNYYYKKVAIPGLRMADHLDLRVIKKNNFLSGFTSESWSEGSYFITDGNLWINYGTKQGANAYTETGAGDYQVFMYK